MAMPDKHKLPSVHRGLVFAAWELLEMEKHTAAERYSVGALETMVEESTAPDAVGDRQQGRGRHYYCAVSPNGKPHIKHAVTGGYRNGRDMLAPSPLTMMQGEYCMALALWRAGRFTPAYKSLSRAMHMVADICCPPHVCGLTYFSRYAIKHRLYEMRAAEIFWGTGACACDEKSTAKKWAAEGKGSVPYDAYKDLLAMLPDLRRPSGFAEICNRLAEDGSRDLETLLGGNDLAMERSIRERLRTAVVNCAALLAAFDRDLEDAALPVFEERRPYFLCCPSARAVVSQEPLYLLFEEDGSVSFSTLEQQFLGVDRWGKVSLTAQTTGVTTRFYIGFEPMLTLYPNGNQSTPLTYWHRALRARKRIALPHETALGAASGFALVDAPPANWRCVLGTGN